MNATGPVLPLALSLAIGLLIGLERGWHEREAKEGRRVAGVRTYALIGLLGGFIGLLAAKTQFAVIGLAFIGLSAALIASYAASTLRDGDIGVTSLIAALLTFAFGVATTFGFMAEAAMAAVVTTLLLSQKTLLHRWVGALEPAELHAALQLLVISVVVLPLLPNEFYGPWQALNPFEIWWMVVLIAAISFSGYFAMKIVGPGKGALLTGLLGGLASSTALTLHFSRLARRRPNASGILASGILIACGTMFPRMLIVASIVNWHIFNALLVPVMVMAAVVYSSAGFMAWRERAAKPGETTAEVQNPLDLRAAIMFGGLLALILVAVKGLESVFGDAGILAMACISGLADVDAITLALARMSRSDLTIDLAAFGIVLAGAVNSLVKAGMAVAIGGMPLGSRTAGPLLAAAVAGLVMAWVSADPSLSGIGNR